MQIGSFALAARHVGAVLASRYHVLVLATALAGTVFGLLATDAQSQGLDMKGGDITNVGNITANRGTITGFNRVSAGVVHADDGLDTSGSTVLGDNELDTLRVEATSTFNAPVTINSSLTTGKATLDSLEVTNDAAVRGGLTVEKDAAVKGGLTVEKDAAVMGGLTVEKDAAVKGGLTVEKDAAVKGKLIVESDTEVKGALTVAKGATVSESFTITPGSLISMGGNRVQDVADPLLDTDAANKRYVDVGLAAVNTKLASAFKEIDKNSQGIAIAMAMSGLALPSDKNFALGVNMGFFDDKQAVALQAAIRVNPFVTITGGFGTGIQDVGTVGGRVGVQMAW